MTPREDGAAIPMLGGGLLGITGGTSTLSFSGAHLLLRLRFLRLLSSLSSPSESSEQK